MNLILIAFLLLITYNTNGKEVLCDDAANQEESTTPVGSTVSVDTEEIKELLKNNDVESAAVLISKVHKQASESRQPANEESSKMGLNIPLNKSYSCSILVCPIEDTVKAVCACNFNTGNVASFKNKCDVRKHNCRFDTNFHVILEDICPWEFAFRRGGMQFEFDYRDAKYYN